MLAIFCLVESEPPILSFLVSGCIGGHLSTREGRMVPMTDAPAICAGWRLSPGGETSHWDPCMTGATTAQGGAGLMRSWGLLFWTHPV